MLDAGAILYREDIELGLRVLGMGRDLVVVPSARSRHFRPKARASAAAAAPIAYHQWKNLFALYALQAPAHVLLEFFLRCGVRTLRANGDGPPVRAWTYLARHLPALLRDRVQSRDQRESARLRMQRLLQGPWRD